ncbi:MAG: flippase [Thermodesulfobacteriota bacterium]
MTVVDRDGQQRGVHRGLARIRAALAEPFVRGSVITFACHGLGIVLGYLFALLISRRLGAEAMGLFTIAYTVLNIATVLGRLGLDIALLRFVAEFSAREQGEQVRRFLAGAVAVALPCSLGVGLLLFLAAGPLARDLFRKPELEASLREVACLVPVLALFFLQTESLRGLRRIGAYGFLQNASLYLFSCLAAFLLLEGLDWEGAQVPIQALGAAIVLATVIGGLLLHRQLGLAGLYRGGMAAIRPMLAVSLPLMTSKIMFFVMGWVDILLLGVFRTGAEVGIYNIAVRLSSVVGIVLLVINVVVAPRYAQLHTLGDRDGFVGLVWRTSRVVFISSLPLLLLLLLLPGPVLGVFGEEFRQGSQILALLALGEFINANCGSVGIILQMTGRERLFRNIACAATVLNLGLNSVFIPRFGIYGAAVTNVATVSSWNLLAVWLVWREFGVLTPYVPGLERLLRRHRAGQ